MNNLTNNQETETPQQTFLRVHYELSENTNFMRWSGVEQARNLCEAYHTARKAIEQKQPVNSLQECKEKIAHDDDFEDWHQLKRFCYKNGDEDKIEDYLSEAAELYASQFK